MRDLGCLCVFVLQFSDALLDRFTALLRWEMAEVVADRTLALRPGGCGGAGGSGKCEWARGRDKREKLRGNETPTRQLLATVLVLVVVVVVVPSCERT